MDGERSTTRHLLAALLIPLAAAAFGVRCGGGPGVTDPHAGLGEPPRPPLQGARGSASPPRAADPGPPSPVDFASRVRPLLRARCSPCHFPGGQMHDRLPFDDEDTVRALGEALFTRLKDPEARAILEPFLQSPATGEP